VALNHNKKRNSNLLREFFSKYIASCIVSKDYEQLKVAHNVWNKYVRTDSELKKEMKLAQALEESKFSNKEIALKFLNKIQEECKDISFKKLEEEKTSFVREINNKLNRQVFYEAAIDNYKDIASTQLLLNSWMKESDTLDASEQAQLEDRVLNYLCAPFSESLNKNNLEQAKNMLLEKDSNDEIDGLTISIMHKKLNEKYASQLSEEQKNILKQFVFDASSPELKESFHKLKEETLQLLQKETSKKVFDKKLFEIKNILEHEDVANVKEDGPLQEEQVVFFMTVSKLNEDLKEKDAEQ